MTWLYGLCLTLNLAFAAHDDPPRIQRPTGVTAPVESGDQVSETADELGVAEVDREPVGEPASPPSVRGPEDPQSPELLSPLEVAPIAPASMPSPMALARQRKNAAIMLGLSPIPLGIAATMQYWAYHRYRKFCCHDPMLSPGWEGIGEAIGHGVGCGFSVIGTGAIRAGGVMFLGGTVGMVAVGAQMLGSRAAEIDRHKGEVRNTGALLGIGTTLVVVGGAAGITSGVILSQRIWNSETSEQALARVRWRSVSFDASMIGVAIGAGVLAYALAYRRTMRGHRRASLLPMICRNFIGISGRFG
jgi:hypothetical protein